MEGMTKVPVREQDAKVRATNFEEVCLGYNEEEAVEEAKRCLNCKNPDCLYSDWRGDCPDMSEQLFLADFFSLQESE